MVGSTKLKHLRKSQNHFLSHRQLKQHLSIFAPSNQGDVAQLARALDWQSRGRGFESHLLHTENQRVTEMKPFFNFHL